MTNPLAQDLGGVVHTNNGELCRFAMHWEIDGDYIRCRKCKQPQLTSYADQEFRHTPTCKAAGKVETHPWITYLRLLIPVADLLGVTRTHSAEIEGALRDAERYRWLREHFRFANDSMHEIWFDDTLEPDDSVVPTDLDQTIDSAMQQGGGGG